LLFALKIFKFIILYFKVIKSSFAVLSIFITINSLSTFSILSESLSLQVIVLYEFVIILVVVLFDSLIASTIILLGALNLNIMSFGIAKLRAISFLSKSTLRFSDSLAILIAILYNCLVLTNIPSSSLT
jgi:hypothetical protein